MKRLFVLPLALAAALAGGAVRVMQDQCGPFTDVTPSFCPYILELYYLGITAGTSATTFSPDDPLTRGQASVFVAKGLNQSLARSSRRAALGQWWTTQSSQALGLTTIGLGPRLAAADGADIWVAHLSGRVVRVRAGDGRVLETWTAPPSNSLNAVLVAMGRVFVTGNPILAVGTGGAPPGSLYRIDPSQPAGAMTSASDTLGFNAYGVAFDGSRVWTANVGLGTGTGSISIVTPGPSLPWATTTIATGFSQPFGAIFDGASVWVTDTAAGTLLRLDSSGGIALTVTVGAGPGLPVFDGENIWVPLLGSDSLAVVRASTGVLLATMTGNGMHFPRQAAFDGERILVTSGDAISLWKAADLSSLGFLPMDLATAAPFGACSDGLNFWVTLVNGAIEGHLGRF